MTAQEQIDGHIQELRGLTDALQHARAVHHGGQLNAIQIRVLAKQVATLASQISDAMASKAD